MYRTHNCGELRISDSEKEVSLCGWVHKPRDKGFMVWVDLRDRYGITQLIFDEQRSTKKLLEKAKGLGREFVIKISGKVIERSSKNPNIPTGDIEILVSDLEILNKSQTPPFTIENNTDGGEELRMKYRYLDIRRNLIKEKLIFRHKVSSEIRKYLTKLNFIDVETPCLIKSTPEGARDFVVPSRMNQGEFYALPQSPQTFKQLLMVGGIDRYFQIVKCFRDEDLRADRQPEFTQLDIEMSFVSEEEIISFNEKLIKNVWKNVLNINFNEEFPRMTWQEAMDNYGTDRPDTRYEMLLKNLGGILGNIGFNIFTKAIQNGGAIKSITIKDGNTSISNVRIKPGGDIFKVAQDAGAGGLAFIRVKGDELETIGAIKNNLNKDHISNILKITEAKDGDLILLGAGNTQTVNQ